MKGTIDEQIEIEENQQNKHVQKYLQQLNKAITGNRFDETAEGKILVKLGFIVFRDAIAKYLSTKSRGPLAKTKNFIKMLSDDPDELALISLNVIIGHSAGKKSKLTNVSEKITSKLLDLHFFSRLKEDNPKLHAYLGTEYKRANARRKEQLIKKHIDKLYQIDFKTNMSDKKLAVAVGTELISILINSGANIVYKSFYQNFKNKFHYY